MSELLVIMYHYVKGSKTPFIQNFHGPNQEEFKDQLILLSKNYKIITYIEFLAALNSKMDNLPDKVALITFDDGTADNYYNAFPILKDLGHSAIFFLISDAITKRKLQNVHASHLLYSKIGMELFYSRFKYEFENKFGNYSDAIDGISESILLNTYRWDSLPIARFKYFMNFLIDEGQQKHILKIIFEIYYGNWDEWGNQFYLSIENIRTMVNEGYYFGGHSNSHLPLGMIEKRIMEDDVQSCMSQLSNITETHYMSFSYPFGKKIHYNKDVVSALKENRFSCAFTNEQGMNNINYLKVADNRYHILRIDPKDLPNYCS